MTDLFWSLVWVTPCCAAMRISAEFTTWHCPQAICTECMLICEIPELNHFLLDFTVPFLKGYTCYSYKVGHATNMGLMWLQFNIVGASTTHHFSAALNSNHGLFLIRLKFGQWLCTGKLYHPARAGMMIIFAVCLRSKSRSSPVERIVFPKGLNLPVSLLLL